MRIGRWRRRSTVKFDVDLTMCSAIGHPWDSAPVHAVHANCTTREVHRICEILRFNGPLGPSRLAAV